MKKRNFKVIPNTRRGKEMVSSALLRLQQFAEEQQGRYEGYTAFIMKTSLSNALWRD